ncbi:DUF1203 domain-containing protein [Aestuariibius insulae]|uniref:DUF1203 domain-containing protein n=1 Tax=Aestuariibius insulae TaxID=2058287 RepID=UPI00345EB89A
MIFLSYDQTVVDAVRAGGPDANGQSAERAISNGRHTPCRCCLRDVPNGEEMLILSARPFPEPQPYAEQGPIFLCAQACVPWSGTGTPPILTTSPDYLIKAYGPHDRIVYGTGRITPKDEIEAYVRDLLGRDGIAYVDVRSARNNCFLTRTRDPDA